MILAAIALLLGVLGFVSGVPVIPIIGLALSLNSLIKEARKSAKDRTVMAIAIVATVLCGIATLRLLLRLWTW